VLYDKRPTLIIKKEQDKVGGMIVDKDHTILDSFEIPLFFNMNSIDVNLVSEAASVILKHKINPYDTKVILCGKQVMFRSFFTYYKNKKELYNGINKEIKAKISFSDEQFRYDFLYKKVPEGFFVNVGAIKENHVGELLEFLTKLNIKPSVLTIEPILLHKFVLKEGIKDDLYIFYMNKSIHYLTYQNSLLMNYQKISIDSSTSPYEVNSYTDHAKRETGTEQPDIIFYKYISHDDKNVDFIEELEKEYMKPRQVIDLNQDPLLL
jgi:hypothetical protein